MDILFDMETNDPDDVMTLCILSAHPNVNLRAVTVMPGTDEQVGLVHRVLELTDHPEIPVGSYAIGYEKPCVSGFHNKWFGKWEDKTPDGEGYQIIKETVAEYPELTILTGGPLKNFRLLDAKLPIHRWVAQGGFAGDNVVPPEHRLPKFVGRTTCPTFNFGGDPKTASKLLATPQIEKRLLVSKNVCHGLAYDAEMHEKMEGYKDSSAGLHWVYKGMDKYLQRRPNGKLFHDPLAACVAIDPSICEFREVELFRARGEWGSNLVLGTNTFISIAADKDRFFDVMVGV
ncbi:MAG: nucleoside hydrolase [Aureispira sp.]|nr:nucleoside hydrolase [Aureispira sp.]